MKIRIGTQQDFDYFNEHLAKEPDSMRKMNITGIRTYTGNDTWHAFFVGYIGKKLVGMVELKFIPASNRVYISELFVMKAFRRKRYAMKLLNYALKFASYSWNGDFVYLFTIENRGMEDLAKLCGFENRGVYKEFHLRNGNYYDQTYWVKSIEKGNHEK